MDDENSADASAAGPIPLEQRVSADKRRFLQLVLGSMTAYSGPLMASFSMGGLRIGSSEALADFHSNACNQALNEPISAFIRDDGKLEVSFSAECNPSLSIEFEVRAQGIALYACRNPAGKYPPGLVQEIQEEVSQSVIHGSTAGNLIEGTVVLSPPPPARRCPPPHQQVLAKIEYLDIEVENLNEEVVVSGGEASRTFVSL